MESFKSHREARVSGPCMVGAGQVGEGSQPFPLPRLLMNICGVIQSVFKGLVGFSVVFVFIIQTLQKAVSEF